MSLLDIRAATLKTLRILRNASLAESVNIPFERMISFGCVERARRMKPVCYAMRAFQRASMRGMMLRFTMLRREDVAIVVIQMVRHIGIDGS